jgi:hypothetical protein
VRQRAAAGVQRLWVNRALGCCLYGKSIELCKQNGIDVIAGVCPMMFQEWVDIGHRCMKLWFRATGAMPSRT